MYSHVLFMIFYKILQTFLSGKNIKDRKNTLIKCKMVTPMLSLLSKTRKSLLMGNQLIWWPKKWLIFRQKSNTSTTFVIQWLSSLGLWSTDSSQITLYMHRLRKSSKKCNRQSGRYFVSYFIHNHNLNQVNNKIALSWNCFKNSKLLHISRPQFCNNHSSIKRYQNRANRIIIQILCSHFP